MASGFTNRGKKLMLDWGLISSRPSAFYMALVTSDNTPGVLTNTLSDLTEIPIGNGYNNAGGKVCSFGSLVENDGSNFATVTVSDVIWVATAGPIPTSGTARWAVILDDNVTPASRQVLAWLDLGAERQVTAGNSLAITGAILKGS